MIIRQQLIDEPDFEWLLIDASHIKIHPHATGARHGNEAMGRMTVPIKRCGVDIASEPPEAGDRKARSITGNQIIAFKIKQR